MAKKRKERNVTPEIDFSKYPMVSQMLKNKNTPRNFAKEKNYKVTAQSVMEKEVNDFIHKKPEPSLSLLESPKRKTLRKSNSPSKLTLNENINRALKYLDIDKQIDTKFSKSTRNKSKSP